MRKICLMFLFCIVYSCFIFVQAAEYKPLISGNFEQGHRLYDLEEGEGDYYFREGWLKLKQKLSSDSYYYLKVRYAENDFMQRNQYDSLTLDLTTNYTYQIFDPLRMKAELRLREKGYRMNQEKGYLGVTTDLEFSYRPGSKDHFQWSVSYQLQEYELSNRTNALTGLSLRWERKIWQGFKLHGLFKYSSQNYFAVDALPDKQRESISVGFEYQL